jgi:nitroimidazol reductase NimA-like FMN-containing flavoprotein (pyridoxamine 5'-phosphate oxidase superfamily)
MSKSNSNNAIQPVTELQPQFSSGGATAAAWTGAREHLRDAEVYWLSTVRPDGRPHVTPLVSVWLDGALYFCTGPGERKAKNLDGNSHCVITTGCNMLSDTLDLVVEGDAVLVSDKTKLQRLADRFSSKYKPPFNFTVRDLDELLVYEVAPVTAFGFGRGEAFSQTRWRFERE